MLSKAILTTRDVLADSAHAQRLSLFFDRIAIWPLGRIEVDADENRRIENEMSFLREKGLVIKCGFEFPTMLSPRDGNKGVFSGPAEDCDELVPFQVVAAAAETKLDFRDDIDRLIFGIADQLTYQDAPVVAHAGPIGSAAEPLANAIALRITIDHFPVPRADMPWDDFLQFRSDPENVARLKKLRLWIQKQGSAVDTVQGAVEELEVMLHEYEAYMRIQGVKFGHDAISTLIASSLPVVENLLNFRFGSALKALVKFDSMKLAYKEAELLAPGREVSYITKVREWLGKGS